MTRRSSKVQIESKSQQIRDALSSGDQIGALRTAAHFHDRSPATLIYKRGYDAHNNPAFYRQLGHDPDHLRTVALQLLQTNFDPHRDKIGALPQPSLSATVRDK